jgi:glycerophosphoryl diester phosphodiesterase
VTQWLKHKRNPVVIAHRGCWEFAPENSLKSLQACFGTGVDIVEGDVRSLKDGVLVLLHDETLDRTTNLSGALKTFTYGDLKRAVLRSGAGGQGAPLTTEHIPRFSEILKTARGHVFLLLHLKEQNYDEVFATVLAEHAQSRVIFLPDVTTGKRFRDARFHGRSAWIPFTWGCGATARPAGCYEHFEAAVADYQSLDPIAYFPVSDDHDFLKEAATLATKSRVRLLESSDDDDKVDNPESVWGPLVDLNVSLILTNHPLRLISYLKAKGLR